MCLQAYSESQSDVQTTEWWECAAIQTTILGSESGHKHNPVFHSSQFIIEQKRQRILQFISKGDTKVEAASAQFKRENCMQIDLWPPDTRFSDDWMLPMLTYCSWLFGWDESASRRPKGRTSPASTNFHKDKYLVFAQQFAVGRRTAYWYIIISGSQRLHSPTEIQCSQVVCVSLLGGWISKFSSVHTKTNLAQRYTGFDCSINVANKPKKNRKILEKQTSSECQNAPYCGIKTSLKVFNCGDGGSCRSQSRNPTRPIRNNPVIRVFKLIS